MASSSDTGEAFGSLVRRYRRAAGLTQQELAEAAGLSVRGISDIERGTRHTPRKDTVQLLMDALRLEPDDREQLVQAARLQRQAARRTEAIQPPSAEREAAAIRTFLFADLRGYTQFTLQNGDEAAARLVATFVSAVREIVTARDGMLLEVRGDEALCIFPSARQALQAAVELQARFAAETAQHPSLPLTGGIGLDAGEAVPVAGGYRGTALNLASRLCALAQTGEVLATDTVAALARRVEGLRYARREPVAIKGFDDPVQVVEVVAGGGGETDTAVEVRPRQLPIGGFLGAVPPERLVSRDAEVQRMLDAVEAVSLGEGRLLLVTGEPGVGKTRLAQEVMLRLGDHGFLVAIGRCYESRQVVPFYPFLEALSAAHAAAPAILRHSIPRRWPYLVRLLPDLFGVAAPPSSAGPEEQEYLFRAVDGLLRALARDRPVAILLDDLHWADRTSLELLGHLARHTRADRVLLVVTYRDVELGQESTLDRVLLELNREQLAEQIRLRRLDRDGTAALIESVLGGEIAPDIADLIYGRSAGNAFFARELLRALQEHGDLEQRGGRWEVRSIDHVDIPSTIRSAIGQRIGHLQPMTQELLREAAVLGVTFPFDDLRAMGDRPEELVESGLEEASRAGILIEAGEDPYAFSHALIQQTLYGEMSYRRRRRLHQIAAGVLERAGRSTAELPRHLLQAGEEHRALEAALKAGDEAEAVFAHADAEHLFRTALELARATDDPVLEAEALRRLGHVLRYQARYTEALEILEAADRIYSRRGDMKGRLQLAVDIGFVHHVTGALQEGIARIDGLIAMRGDVQVPAELFIPLAHLHMKAGQYEESLAAAERAGEHARESGDDRILAHAEAVRGDALRLLGRPDEALGVLEHTVALTERLGDAGAQFLALDALAELCLLHDLPRSRTYRERAVHVAEQMGDPARTAFELAQLGYVVFCLGDWPAARTQIERALDVAQSSGHIGSIAFALSCLAICDAGQGNLEAARERLEEALVVSERGNVRELLAVVQGVYAELELLAGRPDRTQIRLEPILSDTSLSPSTITSLLPLLAWARLETGDADAAEKLVDRGLELAGQQKNRLASVDGLRIRGMVAAAGQRLAEAETDFEAAVSMGRAMPYPYGVARARLEQGKTELGHGHTEVGRAHLSEALAIFERLGAHGGVESVRVALSSAQD